MQSSLDNAIADALAAQDVPGATALLEQLLRQTPGDVEARLVLATLYREAGRLRDAVLACDAVIEAYPNHADAWLQKAFTLSAGASFDNARTCYARAAELDPRQAEAWAGLSAITVVRGEHEEGRAQAERALALDPGNLVAAAAIGQSAVEQKQAEHARARLERALAGNTEEGPPRVTALSVLGDMLEQLGDYDGAFAAYSASKRLFRSLFEQRFRDKTPAQIALIEQIDRSLRDLDVTNWALPADAQPSFDRHVFLTGYPRSGTTLVENILASADGIVALEERPTLMHADERFLLPDDGMAALRALDQSGARPYRDAYWSMVMQSVSAPGGSMFVDMDPLKGMRLPIIARLFPEARVLLMRRDPREIVWSCYHTNFAMTAATYDYSDLASTARHYDALMRLTDQCVERLPLNTHVVRYESLVTDFDRATQALCGFLGMDWTADLKRFDRTAQRRGVATASATQVRQGLYDGRRQWEPYARYLEPVMPILAPWIERFGYA